MSAQVNRDVTKKTHPEALRPFIPEIKEFARFNHFEVLDKVLRYASDSQISFAA